jgi:hypothetical protein
MMLGQLLKEVLNEMPLITLQNKTAYADDKPLKTMDLESIGNNMTVYHEEKGNFIIAKNKVYLWFTSTEDWVDKVNAGEYDLVMFPIKTLYNAFSVSPITDVWRKSKARGKKEVLGMIEAYLDDKELIIQMMSVRNPYRKNRINSFMIDELKQKFPSHELVFEDPTDDGWKFIANYDPNARAIDYDGNEVSMPDKLRRKIAK